MIQPSPSPIIVKLVEPRKESLYDVMVGALGVTGVMVVLALVAAFILAGLLIWSRSRKPLDH